ncbi:MAG: hypothetical protein ACXWJM_13350 [Ramlibacter sp.]
MQNNPYTPPTAPLKDQPRAPGSPVKAVLVGLAIDVGGSLVLGVTVTVVYAFALSSQGMSQKEVATALVHIPTDSWPFIVGTLGGAFLSFLGGYWCARIARRSEYRLASLLALVSAASGLALSWGAYGLLHNTLLTLSTAACVILGAKYGRAANAA